MSRPDSVRLPRLPAAARKAGATDVRRASERVFLVGFRLTDEGLSAPGRGAAVLEALRSAFPDFTISWVGEQGSPIVMRAERLSDFRTPFGA